MPEAEPQPPERLSYRPLIALQSRMLLAASDFSQNLNVINPDNTAIAQFNREQLSDLTSHNYSLFNNASTNERRRENSVKREELDTKVLKWATDCVSLL